MAIDWNKRYSYSSEDYILRMLFPQERGHYLETGVHHWRDNSNTFIFYELGWRGLLIEPLPYWCRMARVNRPRDIVLECGVWHTVTRMPLNIEKGNGTGTPATTLRTDWCMGETTQTAPVRLRPLRDILAEHVAIRNDCQIFSLDVEGVEKQALEGVDFTTFRPHAICIEALRWNPFRRVHGDWEHILLAAGYKLICHNFQNRFYGRTDNTELWENVRKWNLAE